LPADHHASTVTSVAAHCKLSLDPADYVDKGCEVIAIALVEPTIDEIRPLTKLSPQMQWFQTYFHNIPDLAFLRVVEVAFLHEPQRVVEALPLDAGNTEENKDLRARETRRVQALSPLLLDVLRMALCTFKGQTRVVAGVFAQWCGDYQMGYASFPCISCNALIAHLVAAGHWSDVGFLKPGAGAGGPNSNAPAINGVWPPVSQRASRRTSLTKARPRPLPKRFAKIQDQECFENMFGTIAFGG
jgi:hypothetical protein